MCILKSIFIQNQDLYASLLLKLSHTGLGNLSELVSSNLVGFMVADDLFLAPFQPLFDLRATVENLLVDRLRFKQMFHHDAYRAALARNRFFYLHSGGAGHQAQISDGQVIPSRVVIAGQKVVEQRQGFIQTLLLAGIQGACSMENDGILEKIRDEIITEHNSITLLTNVTLTFFYYMA